MTDVAKLIEQHKAEKARLIEEEKKLHFSYDIRSKLTDAEKAADAKLQLLKDKLATPLHNVVIQDFYEQKPIVERSQLHQVLDAMPKGALHHLHTTAGPHVETYIKLTYDPLVSYNEREGMFKVMVDGHHEDGYVQCTQMRSFYKDPEEYDEQLRQAILLVEQETAGLESHDIWKGFQHKFSRVSELGKYNRFFKTLLRANIDACIAQNIFVVELRHTSGCLFDDKRQQVSIKEELDLVQEVVDEVKKEHPHFELMLIIVGYKIVGHPHVKKMLDYIRQAKETHPALIAGFDMVNEEEFTPEISEFMPEILGAQKDEKCGTKDMDCFFHAGETHDGEVTNLHDAVLLNTKRIGHGFQLALFPNLLKEVIKRDICVEACPLSNMVLGYTLDLRTHPIRFMLAHGLQITISSDDPGFFNYQGVTLDYTYATLAWELDIADLKKLSLNGIKYSTISSDKKKYLEEEVFPARWNAFVEKLCTLEIEE